MDLSSIFTYVITAVVVFGLIAILLNFTGKRSGKGKKNGQKTQAQIIKEANRRLSKDPNDPAGLTPLGDIYYKSRLWDKAVGIYDTLSRMSAGNATIDAFKVFLRFGVCCLQTGKIPEACQALSTAAKLNSQDFDANYYLGQALFKNKVYDKAVPFLKKSLVLNPDARGVYGLLGQSLYNAKHYRESFPCLKKALDEDPTNKELLFCMADAMTEEGHEDKAIKVFMHLRPDPVYGARASLQAGLYHANINDTDSAIQDFEIGLKHENTPQDIHTELEYRLAQQYFAKNLISNGLMLLKQIRNSNANYKDVNSLIARYQELSQNKNLQVYLAAGNSDFVALCRKFISTYYKDGYVKILDIQVGAAYTDILAEISSSKWEDTELFRFFRTTSATGEIYVREFNSHMHDDLKADRGFCITAGTFSEESHKYIDGRPVDLIEKPQLVKILKLID